MKGEKVIIDHLNKILKNELTAINQYFLHSRMLGDWGLSKLEEHEYDASIDEMKHADEIMKRVLFLGGLPNLQDLGRLRIGENVEEIIKADLAVETEAVTDLKAAIADCENLQDYVTRDLFVHILESEEEHIDWLETQQSLIEKMGLQNYVQLQTESKGPEA
ncbi:bacterioferritin [Pyruvatibacter mobilis]|uniref:bacterioferritin n=1 Tax=Pyruvatibacter mobilis TaxID=1712261 RepID=UPI003BB01283